MALYLEILSGDQMGVRVKIVNDLVIGRKEGLLTIRDSKLSSKHARVESKGDGIFWLVDLDSANGIKLQDSRVQRLKLEPGTRFTLGRTKFLVISYEEPSARVKDQTEDFLGASANANTVTRTHWVQLRELSEQLASAAQARQSQLKVRITPFNPALRLEFIKGLQTGTLWTLGYGPRNVGSKSLDLPLEDVAPDVSFQILPALSAARGAILKCENKSDVSVNGKTVKSSELKNGDVIEVASTQIRVTFDE
jgi:pSer/pThr/pTyr-binding forkhead associated (FHA) protein